MKEQSPTVPDLTQPAPASPGHAGRPAPPSRKRWPWLLLLVAVAGAAYLLWPKPGSQPNGGTSPEQASGKKGGRGGRGGRGAIPPVVVVRAHKGNIGVYFTGLGNVTPIYTVTVKSRVDGQLMDVHFKEGDTVRRGDPLAEIDPRPYQVQLEQYEGQLARDQALLQNAQVDLSRYEGLLKQNAIPEQQYATQKATVLQDQGVVTMDQGLIDSAKLNLTYCHITSPIAGRVGLRLVDPGNIVHAADTNGLLVITQMQPISVIFTIAEDQLPPVLSRWRAGQKLTVEAWDRAQQNRIATGTLSTIDNQIDQTTGTLRLRAEFPNTDNALFPNQFVNARLLVQQKRGVTLIPTAAIQRTSHSIYVYLVKPDSSVTVRNITLGTSEGDVTEVTEGLEPNDEVVMTGVDKLTEGVKVTVEVQDGQHVGGGRGQHSGAGSAGRKTQ